MLQLAEVLPAGPEEGGPATVRVAAHPGVGVGMARRAVDIPPDLASRAAPLDVDRPWIPVGLLAWHELPALEEEDSLARWGQAMD